MKAVDDVKQIPRKMSESVTSTVKDVQATVEEIQAIPTKVNNSIEETKKFCFSRQGGSIFCPIKSKTFLYGQIHIANSENNKNHQFSMQNFASF